jgi:hypothetical protein
MKGLSGQALRDLQKPERLSCGLASCARRANSQPGIRCTYTQWVRSALVDINENSRRRNCKAKPVWASIIGDIMR